ncbi:winged helix-turn-helix domain-containing protein [Streptomyces sp. NPDC060027]|uniref:winged helix-turn-helix domain-containing protein n=1 Tax=Streptomyces sp. NPDC060027 TaxID=3347040 RepID=UPI0036BE5DDC
MTTALPAQTTSSDPAFPGTRRLHLVDDASPSGTEDYDAPRLVGYLVFVPEGTDPATLFAENVPRPEIRPLAHPDSPPVRRTGHGALRIDIEQRVAEVDGRELDLTYLEFGLLAHLVLHPQQVHSRERLMAVVWGYDHIGDGRTVDVHIARLRHKLGKAHRRGIVTVRSVGYKYVPEQQGSTDTAPCRRT